MTPTLTLVRHAATPLNRERRYVGHLDPALDAGGERAARRLGRRLAPLGRATGGLRIWCSDLERARRTAELAFPDLRPRVDPRLRELDFGAFDGATYEENLRRHGRRFRRWIDDPAAHPPPDGEPLPALRTRVLGWLDAVPRSGDVVAVTHGGPLRVLAAHVLALPPGETRAWPLPPASALRCALAEAAP